ncbi:hypothetical protein [Neorhizobium tomejilense]|uniref:hypothetical protein n=1 Tax=Neorhizobium tomejilense TaxID=2093828 RepID=UPI003ECE9D7E
MAQLPIRPITTKQRLMGCVVLFKPAGTEKLIKFGPCESVEITPNITQVPSYTNEFGDRRLIGNFTTEKSGTIGLNGLSMWTELLYQALFMANKKYRTQAAVTSQTISITDVAVGDIVRIPAIRATAVTVSDAGAAVYVENTHFTYHAKTGLVEIVALPADAEADATVTYSAPAITEADKLLDLSVMETSGIRGELHIVGVIAAGQVGKETEVVLHDVEFIPSGAISVGDAANLNTATLTGSMYSTSASGYGYMRGLEAV